jgi:hypothetical protein
MSKPRVQNSVLYTTIHPTSLPYVAEWYESVRNQHDQRFDICMGVDKLSKGQVSRCIGKQNDIFWVFSEEMDSPATLRTRALRFLADKYDYIILADSDDVLLPNRIGKSKLGLKEADVSACAMMLVDKDMRDLGMILGHKSNESLDKLIPYGNVFGFSNSAYRSGVIKKCLPIPPTCALVDWYLVTMAWIQGATLHFDPKIHMKYRQHPNNIANVLPPFSESQLLGSTKLLLEHYRLIISHGHTGDKSRKINIEVAAKRSMEFYLSISGSKDLLNRYLESLNKLSPTLIWWSIVAHPKLSQIWKK